VVTEHNRWPRYDPVTRLANRATIGLDDADLAVSEDVRATMGTRHRDRVEVLRHGVDLEAVRAAGARGPAARAALGVGPGDVVVATVANLRREKGLDVLLDAAARVAADPRGARVRFVVVGQGPLADELAARHARLGLGGTVSLAGYRPDAVEVVAAADVFCLASRHEGLPVALMEALALGRPVVATTVGGVPELVRDGVEGRLVAPDDPGSLAEALLEVAGDPALRARLAAGAAAAEAAGIGPAQARLESLYRELAGRRVGQERALR
jgi:glycosyltransferase involved in cell wall biosynthesis